jgi:hypothetical protein
MMPSLVNISTSGPYPKSGGNAVPVISISRKQLSAQLKEYSLVSRLKRILYMPHWKQGYPDPTGLRNHQGMCFHPGICNIYHPASTMQGRSPAGSGAMIRLPVFYVHINIPAENGTSGDSDGWPIGPGLFQHYIVEIHADVDATYLKT